MKAKNQGVLDAMTVARVLYIVGRHEYDALRECVLPARMPEGKLLYARYQNKTLYCRFLENKTIPILRHPVRLKQDALLSDLASERGWFFRWGGDGIGFQWLTPAEVTALYVRKRHQETNNIHQSSNLVDSELIRFAESHLYP